MKKLFVTMPRLKATIAEVEREIKKLGLWHPGLEDVQVYLIPVHVYYGFSLVRTGDIYIPRLSIGAVMSPKPWTLRDIVRHEYGHALSYLLEGWEEVFDAEESVSAYRETNPYEDFAENLRFYLKHKGKLPRKWTGNSAIHEKWDFLKSM